VPRSSCTAVTRGKVATVSQELQAAHEGASVQSLVADLASLEEVDQLADTVLAEHSALHALVNNAGVGFGAQNDRRKVSRRHRAVVRRQPPGRLPPRPPAHPAVGGIGSSRIVQVASAGQEPLDFDDPMIEHGYDGVTAYRRSKLAQVMATFDLAEELASQGVTANALHPATFMDTGIVRDAGIRPTSPEGSRPPSGSSSTPSWTA